MTKLSDTQLVILGAAAQRSDLSVLPLPDRLRLKGGALAKVMDSLRNRGLVRVIGAHGGPQRVVITSEGMAAIGIEPEGDGEPRDGPEADTGATTVEAGGAGEGRAGAAEADIAAAPAGGKPEAAPDGQTPARPTPRAGTKQAMMIEMLKRPEGATVDQIAAATGWQHHTIRGAISGALKKKLGLTVEARRSAPTSVVGAGSQARDMRAVGPNQTGAKGSATTYRIVE